MEISFKIGDILQIDPEANHPFPGFFLVVTEPKPWGAQGYLLHIGDFPACRFNGMAFARVTFSQCVKVGCAEWLINYSQQDPHDQS